MKLKLAVILPHTQIFGGVKRFMEIGNLLIARGHSFTIFTPEGVGPTWFDFKGETAKLSSIRDYTFDALFITETDYVAELKSANTRLRIFYAVLQRPYVKRILREEDVMVFANSTRLFKYLGGERNPRVVMAVGGIDVGKFAFAPKVRVADSPFVVMAYGRFYRRKKGTMMVVRACERLYRKGYNIHLQLFDSPVDEDARKKVKEFRCSVPFEFFVDYPVRDVAKLYYNSDVFVSAERNAGWCNTGAEAMACGVPLIATTSGTKDFLIHNETGLVVWRHSFFIQRALKKLMDDEKLRRSFIEPARRKIEGFSWENLAGIIENKILAYLASK